MKELTAEDFGMQFDTEHYFAFIENEDATIMAWGHRDADALLDEVFAYDKLCDAMWAERGEPGDLSFVWAVQLESTPESENQDAMWWVTWGEVDGVQVTEQTPGAMPITIWAR